MHMADALLSPHVAAAMGVITVGTLGTSVIKINKSNDIKTLPTMAVGAALVFAGQMVNFTIPGTGASGHICGGMLLSAILGPYAAFLSMTVILLVQCLLFADGGLMALGANCFNMAFYGCFVGYYLIWKPVMDFKKSVNFHDDRRNRIKIILASVLGCVITLQLGAFSVVLETKLSGISELPFMPFLSVMLPVHLVIGLVEGCLTAAVLLFIYAARPELIKDISTLTKPENNKHSFKSVIIVLALCTLVIGGGLSLYASDNPDGLEWSLFGNEESGYSKNMALDEDNYGINSNELEIAEGIQEKTALLPDYSFKNSDSGKSFSGIIGSAVVALIAAVTYFVLKRKRE